MISINWTEIIGAILVALSGLGGLAWGGKAAWSKWKSQPVAVNGRSADEPAPEGSVAWVNDICDAMGDASAESKLKNLQAGATRDQARAWRITELEGGAKVNQSFVPMDLKPRVIQEPEA